MPQPLSPTLKPLKGVRILSLALNLPGPAALMRCHQLGAICTKLEPPGSVGMGHSGDPMALYRRDAYDAMHDGVRILQADLKTEKGQVQLHKLLAKTDVLLTSFRPSAMAKLQLDFKHLHKCYPTLNQVAIVGAPAPRQEEPGHDLTYMAENDLVTGLDLPPSLYADMAGSLLATEAILQVLLLQKSVREKQSNQTTQAAKGRYLEVALSDASMYLGLPRAWKLTTPGAAVGGGHAGYKVYACKDGRVAIAALEPHFAARLVAAAGLPAHTAGAMMAKSTHTAIAQWCLTLTRKQFDKLSGKHDIPLFTLA
jgi:alpha-methylacyl-CoA racemase